MIDGAHVIVYSRDAEADRDFLRDILRSNSVDAGDGWLRERFTELGVIQFEDWTDTGEEYATLDEVSKDREPASA